MKHLVITTIIVILTKYQALSSLDTKTDHNVNYISELKDDDDDRSAEDTDNTTLSFKSRFRPYTLQDRWSKASFERFIEDGGMLTFHDNATESDVKNMLLANYDRTSRPVFQDEASVTATVGFSLYNILDTNEKFHTISTLLSIRLRWKDRFLRWRSNRVKSIYIPADHIWVPDIVIANSAEATNGYVRTNTIVSSNGDVLWMFPMILKSQCIFQVFFFPFDCQKCNIVLISWTYAGHQVDLQPDPTDNNSVYYNPRNQEWFVDSINVSRNVASNYECCPNETFPDVTFTIYLRRRSQFYVLNLIYPCLLFYILSFLGFLLPLESGDKVNMEITVLLSLVVFMMFVNEMLPPTANILPAIGIIVVTTMIEVVIALLMAVVVTYMAHLNHKAENIPNILAWILENYGNQETARKFKHAILKSQGVLEVVEDIGSSKKFLPASRTSRLRNPPPNLSSRDIIRLCHSGDPLPEDLPPQQRHDKRGVFVSVGNSYLAQTIHRHHNEYEEAVQIEDMMELRNSPNQFTLKQSYSTDSDTWSQHAASGDQLGSDSFHGSRKYWIEIARILDRIFIVVFGIFSGLTNLFLYLIMLADDTVFDVFTPNHKNSSKH